MMRAFLSVALLCCSAAAHAVIPLGVVSHSSPISAAAGGGGTAVAALIVGFASNTTIADGDNPATSPYAPAIGTGFTAADTGQTGSNAGGLWTFEFGQPSARIESKHVSTTGNVYATFTPSGLDKFTAFAVALADKDGSTQASVRQVCWFGTDATRTFYNTASISCPSNIPAGDTLVALGGISDYDNGARSLTYTDSNSDTWTQIDEVYDNNVGGGLGNYYYALFIAKNVAALSTAQTITMNASPGDDFYGMAVIDITGVGADPLIGHNSNKAIPASTAADAVTSGPVDLGSGTTATFGIKVLNGQFADLNNNYVQLRGVNVSGMESAIVTGASCTTGPSCTLGYNYFATAHFDGTNGEPNWSILQSEHVSVVRIPLNSESWLGLTTYDPSCASRQGDPGSNDGSAYRSEVQHAVSAAEAAGMYVILDLHWNNPNVTLTGTGCPGTAVPPTAFYQFNIVQSMMADADYSDTFWTSVANTFKSDPAVIFELFNEPYINQASGVGGGWTDLAGASDGNAVWTGLMGGGHAHNYNDGTGTIKAADWTTAGMQDMLDAVRATGATNVVLIGTPGFSGYANQDGNQTTPDDNGFLAHVPTDSLHQMGVVWHPYPNSTDGTIPTYGTAQYTNYAHIQAAGYPVIATETGDVSDGGICTASISGTTVTVSACAGANDAIAVGNTVEDASGTVLGTITALGTGTGQAGTYTLSASATKSSQQMRFATCLGNSPAAPFMANLLPWVDQHGVSIVGWTISHFGDNVENGLWDGNTGIPTNCFGQALFGDFSTQATTAPTITGLSPNPAYPGDTVTITGTGLQPLFGVAVNGTAATTYASASSTSATFAVPAGATTGYVTVENAADVGSRTGASPSQLTIDAVTTPTISSFTPSSGNAYAPITISGTFADITDVKINTTSVSFTMDSHSQVTAYPPGGVSGQITVTNSVGSVTSTGSYTANTGISFAAATLGQTATYGPGAQSITFTGLAAGDLIFADLTCGSVSAAWPTITGWTVTTDGTTSAQALNTGNSFGSSVVQHRVTPADGSTFSLALPTDCNSDVVPAIALRNVTAVDAVANAGTTSASVTATAAAGGGLIYFAGVGNGGQTISAPSGLTVPTAISGATNGTYMTSMGAYEVGVSAGSATVSGGLPTTSVNHLIAVH